MIRNTQGTEVEEYDDLDGPSLLKKTLGLLNKHHSHYVGPSYALEPAVIGGGQPGLVGREFSVPHGVLRWVSPSDAFLLSPDLETQGYSEEQDAVEEIETLVRPYGPDLLDIYFRVVYPSFPVLHKGVYLEKYRRSPLEFVPSSLAVVYLLAIRFWSHDENLQDIPKPNLDELEVLARKALLSAMNRPKISTIQAGLQLLQYTNINSAALTAQLVSVAYGLGLHLDASRWDIPDWEKGLRKRLSWALYLQDKWNSLGSGKPPLINSNHWAVAEITEADFPEQHEYEQEGSSEVEKGRILFCQLISLSKILAEVQDNILSPKVKAEIARAGGDSLTKVLEKAKPIQLKLRTWFTNLPELLSMESTNVMKLSSVAYLRLAYIATDISIHRQILLALPTSKDALLVQACRSAAHDLFTSAMDFVKSLKPHHLSSFWYSAAPQNFALIGVLGYIIYATETDPDRRSLYKSGLREYRWLLKISGENGATYMRQAMVQLEAHFKYHLEPAGVRGRSQGEMCPPQLSPGKAGGGNNINSRETPRSQAGQFVFDDFDISQQAANMPYYSDEMVDWGQIL